MLPGSQLLTAGDRLAVPGATAVGTRDWANHAQPDGELAFLGQLIPHRPWLAFVGVGDFPAPHAAVTGLRGNLVHIDPPNRSLVAVPDLPRALAMTAFS